MARENPSSRQTTWPWIRPQSQSQKEPQRPWWRICTKPALGRRDPTSRTEKSKNISSNYKYLLRSQGAEWKSGYDVLLEFIHVITSFFVLKADVHPKDIARSCSFFEIVPAFLIGWFSDFPSLQHSMQHAMSFGWTWTFKLFRRCPSCCLVVSAEDSCHFS